MLLIRASWSTPASNESSSMRVPAPGGVGQHLGAWRAAFAAQVTRPKKSTSFWSRTSIPIMSAASPLRTESASFQNADVYVAKAESDFWLSPEIAAKAPKDVQPFFQSAQAIAAPYIKAAKWHTFSGSEPIVGMQLVSLPGHTPGHTGYEFSSKGQKI